MCSLISVYVSNSLLPVAESGKSREEMPASSAWLPVSCSKHSIFWKVRAWRIVWSWFISISEVRWRRSAASRPPCARLHSSMCNFIRWDSRSSSSISVADWESIMTEHVHPAVRGVSIIRSRNMWTTRFPLWWTWVTRTVSRIRTS